MELLPTATIIVALIVIGVALYSFRLPQEQRSKVTLLLVLLMSLMAGMMIFVLQGD